MKEKKTRARLKENKKPDPKQEFGHNAKSGGQDRSRKTVRISYRFSTSSDSPLQITDAIVEIKLNLVKSGISMDQLGMDVYLKGLFNSSVRQSGIMDETALFNMSLSHLQAKVMYRKDILIWVPDLVHSDLRR